jgi:acetyl-CoA carboxylase carboxyltransferase component
VTDASPPDSPTAAREWIEALLDPGSFFELDSTTSDGGVVAGAGAIDGRDVAIYAFAAGAAADDVAAAKVVKVQELALQRRIPVIGVDEPAALAGVASVLGRKVRSSGVVPQLSVRTGSDPAGEVCASALADFVLGPGGEAHLPTGDRETVRSLLSYLPGHGGEAPPIAPGDDPVDRAEPGLQALTGADVPWDAREVVSALLDGRRLLEVQRHGAGSVVTGFGRLGGHAVGVVAGGLDGACARAARFIRCCDAFNVPLVSLLDGPGFPSGAAGRAAAQLAYACAEATVPRLAVVVRRDAGPLSSRRLGCDLVLAWPGALIAGMDVYAAAERGTVDAVIEPRETRRALVRGLELCRRKTVERPTRRHGNIPL